MSNLIFHQLFEQETSTYTYIIGDAATKEAVIIDPVVEMVERDLKLIKELGLELKYILDTHVHADHITGSGILRKKTGAKIAVSSAYDLSCVDIHLGDGQELLFGDHKVKAIHTPGHTSGCLSYQIGNMLFTGDALLIRGTGRTDFQQGSSEKLFHSIRDKLFNLPDETVVYPGHDYKGFTKSTIGMEKAHNPRLKMSISKDEFISIMTNLKLANPKKIHEAVPANLLCGLVLKSDIVKSQFIDGVPSVEAEDLQTKSGQLKVIDVRGIDEFNGELGHIAGATLSTLGPELDKYLDKMDREREIVFVCRSGRRSAEATKLAQTKGFERVYNLHGGMLRWFELKLPVEKDMGGS